ncbi:hypothetical protein RYX36_013210 [Vicia faba]
MSSTIAGFTVVSDLRSNYAGSNDDGGFGGDNDDDFAVAAVIEDMLRSEGSAGMEVTRGCRRRLAGAVRISR